MRTVRQNSLESRPALIKIRAHKPELILLTVAAACVISFALWLDVQLRPALVARERNERAADDVRERFAPCLPNAGRSQSSWCGAITILVPRPRTVVPLPLIAGAPAAFCTASDSPSC
jgi:hypothetical protein